MAAHHAPSTAPGRKRRSPEGVCPARWLPPCGAVANLFRSRCRAMCKPERAVPGDGYAWRGAAGAGRSEPAPAELSLRCQCLARKGEAVLRWVIALSLLATLVPPPATAESIEPEDGTPRVLKKQSPYVRTRRAAFRLSPRPTPMASRIGRVVPFTPPAAPQLDVTALARARACKIFDRNGA